MVYIAFYINKQNLLTDQGRQLNSAQDITTHKKDY